MTIRLGVIASLLFGSGFAALVYQTIWQKSFRFVFGASSEASAAVLGIFLGGLGIGGAILGRRAEKSPKPLVLYGNLEIAIALLAAVSPWLIEGATLAYAALGGSLTLGETGATLVRLLLATLAIGPAAFLMGGTLPAAARAAVADSDASRKGLARIYALNTLGAVFGALVGPLLLFGTVGIRFTLFSAVCLNLLVGFMARALGRTHEVEVNQPAPQKKSKKRSTPASSTAQGMLTERRLVYGLAALVGFAFLYLELIWFRMLAPLLGGSSVTFGLILAVALAGIGVGGWLYSLWPGLARSPLQTLSLTLVLEGLFVAIPFAWGDGLALFAAHLRAMANLGYPALVAAWLMVTTIVVFPAAVVSGYQFPVIFALLGQGKKGVAQEVGTAYAFNTVGTITGSIVGGFVLLPWLGATTSWRIAAALLLFAAILVSARALRKKQGAGHWIVFALCSVVASACLLSDGPGKVWRHTPIGAGRVLLAEKSPNDIQQWINAVGAQIAYETDGVEAALAVDLGDGVSFLVNGKSDGSIVGDRGTQIVLGLIPAALHKKPERAFVVGLGTGTSAGMVGLVDSIQRVDVAEIEPAIVHVAKMTGAANAHVLQNPKVNLMLGDARELLLGAKQPYDVIISEPSNPYRIGVASLFTQEFYQLVNRRLAKDGYFAQWIQGYEIGAFALSTAVRTLRAVFKYVSLFGTQRGDYVLIASQHPQTMDMDALRARMARPPFSTWFPRSRGVEGAEAFAAQQLLPSDKMGLLLELVPGAVNTDDLNLLESSFVRTAGHKVGLDTQLHDLVLGHRIEPSVSGQVDRAKMLQMRRRLLPTLAWPAGARFVATAMGCEGKISQAHRQWPRGELPEDSVEMWVYGYGLSLLGDDEAQKWADELAQRGFEESAALVRARWALAKNDGASAVTHLEEVYRLLRERALPICDTAKRSIELASKVAQQDPALAARLYEALKKGSFAGYVAEGYRKEALIQLARLSGKGNAPDPTRCVEALQPFMEVPIWTEKQLQLRWDCYESANHPFAGQAKLDLLKFIQQEGSRYLPADPILPFPLPRQAKVTPAAEEAPPPLEAPEDEPVFAVP